MHTPDPTRYAALLDHPLRARLSNYQARLEFFGISAGMRVLEVGCGTGPLLPPLLERLGPQGRLLAIDVQPHLLERARAKVADDPRATLRLASALQTGEPDGSIDAVIFHHVFHTLPGRADVVREARRILKTGGILGIWEPRLLVKPWRLDAYEGMFWGQRFVLEARTESLLGFGRRFRAVEDAVGSRLRRTGSA